MNDPHIATLGNHYHLWVREHPQAADDIAADVEDLLVDAGVTFDSVTARLKTWPSLKAKAKQTRPDGSLAYPDPWNDIHDLVGVRVTTYHSTEIPRAISVLRDSFQVVKSVDKTEETRVSGSFGYGSHHLVLRVPHNTLDLAEYRGLSFEVQVRTVLQHAWAEFEHDIRYKRGDQENNHLDPQVDRAFTLAAGLIELADQQFDQIAAIQSGSADTSDNLELKAETLPGVLAVLLGTNFPLSRFEHYRWLEELLSAHGITRVKQLRGLLDKSRIDAVTVAMKYRFRPSQVRLIDDLLLEKFGRSHIQKTGRTGNRAEHRLARLRHRWHLLRDAGLVVEDSEH
ncbi:GTP pyrophosphokinase family protein [Corynebacterium poyangense]|uniref:GTP pyrophosphokinase family protein n=1 Tax=Corynebacterium poyangense TaxID=2684405 RepID=A0A7H0SPQ8_9CORY|nr:GTP pyrophosphokinase family protein [Corynebacterium poyangense]MBZ8178119.1 GTP pyrophosphokinase family protein [Corynebacterium poyangense]QNQ90533.1 GTP pyrophosphokinase family protein [Corynebacterium poyangense]